MNTEPLDLLAEFSLPRDRVWLNASHQGPLPNVAAEAVTKMVRWKQAPHHLSTPQPFTEVPQNLRSALAQLLAAQTDEIVLANSSSYGVHLAANGLSLHEGDEVIVAKNDFPSDVLPWLRLRDRGVNVIQVQPRGQVLTPSEVMAATTERTRMVCLTWVHSFSGHVVDIDGIGEVCRSHDALLLLNGSQGIGGIPITPADHPVDMIVSVGFKYLCGPYGTGFCWLGSRAMERLATNKLYWLSALTADDLAAEQLDLDDVRVASGARRHDVFGTANFFNFAALTESVGLVSRVGVDQIYAHNQRLARQFIEGIDQSRYEVESRGDPLRQSSILFLRPTQRSLDEVDEHLLAAGVNLARRRGRLRAAPHFYNVSDDIDRAIAALNSA